MKKYLVLLLLILLWVRGGINLYAQTTLTNYEEFFIEVYNNFNYKKIQLYATPVNNERWDVVYYNLNGENWRDYHPITSKYTGGLSKGFVDTTNGYFGLDLAYDDQGNTPLLGIGLYKITIYENEDPTNAFMYIDYRTSHLGEQVGTPDITFYYDAADQKLYYDKINKQEVISETIWDMKENVIHITTELQPFPPTNFNVSSENNHPLLTWNHSNKAYWTGYEIYRSVVGKGNPPGTFSKIALLGELVTSYIDYDFVTGSTNTSYYKMVAVNGSSTASNNTRHSVFTQTKSINVSLYKENNEHKGFVFYLRQNYPNPFNPSTTITFSIPNKEFVSVKIYDSLGREVIKLINEEKEAGVYSVFFHAADLPSGIYYYTITSGKYSETKKLLLIK